MAPVRQQLAMLPVSWPWPWRAALLGKLTQRAVTYICLIACSDRDQAPPSIMRYAMSAYEPCNGTASSVKCWPICHYRACPQASPALACPALSVQKALSEG